MTKPASTTKKTRKQHTPEFRDEALKLAERIGVAAAARELSLYESQLYNWRSKQQHHATSSEWGCWKNLAPHLEDRMWIR